MTYRVQILKFLGYSKRYIKDSVDEGLEGDTDAARSSREWAGFFLRHSAVTLRAYGRGRFATMLDNYVDLVLENPGNPFK